MSFDFWASSQEDGIVFSYNDNKNAVYVYREDGKIKEREVRKEEIDQGRNLWRYINKSILYSIRCGILILLELILLNLKVKMSDIWLLYILSVIIYVFYIAIYNKKDSRETSKTIKQYHSAEHMVYNARSSTISIKELRKFSKYVNNCGRNDDAMKILNFILIGLLTNIFCSFIKLNQDIYYFMAIYILYVIILNVIHSIVIQLRKTGIYNHIFQPLFLEEPTDEQLELAIYGLRRKKELNKKF